MSKLICHRCNKPIAASMAYIVVRGDIILRRPNKQPMVFSCIEQAYNYAQRLFMHDICWIDMLREHGVELYDMNKVAERRKKEAQDGLGQDKT